MDQHEKQLGRAVKYGFRNDTKSGDERRVFGLPTLELSKRAMNLKENNVISFFELLNYNYNNKFGNCEEELLKLRSKEEMVKILGEMKVNVDMDKMDESFDDDCLFFFVSKKNCSTVLVIVRLSRLYQFEPFYMYNN